MSTFNPDKEEKFTVSSDFDYDTGGFVIDSNTKYSIGTGGKSAHSDGKYEEQLELYKAAMKKYKEEYQAAMVQSQKIEKEMGKSYTKYENLKKKAAQVKKDRNTKPEILAFDPDCNLLAIHEGSDFLRVVLPEEGGYKAAIEAITGTVFEKYKPLIRVRLYNYFPEIRQEEFLKHRASLEDLPIDRLGVADLAALLPGVEMIVKHPETGQKRILYDVVQELNDGYKWSREEIADWIEALDGDIKFK